MKNAFEVLVLFFKLGLTSFGGPVAHLAYFYQEFVGKKKWVQEQYFSEVVMLCQILPGPSSSQVAMALGMARAGHLGAICALLGFLFPSVILLIFFAYAMSRLSFLQGAFTHGLKIAAAAVVLHATILLAQKLCPSLKTKCLAFFGFCVSLFVGGVLGQFLALFFGGVVSLLILKNDPFPVENHSQYKTNKSIPLFFLIAFVFMLALLPILSRITDAGSFHIFDRFFRAGAFVFGGGHVVLPFLQNEIVHAGFVEQNVFLAGYGAAQAVPGPLFAFAAFLGFMWQSQPTGIVAGLIALFAIYLPSFLVLFGVLPFWNTFRQMRFVAPALVGISAIVVGILAAAFVDPVWKYAVLSYRDFGIFIGSLLLLAALRVPVWAVVILTAAFSHVVSIWVH